MKKTWIFCSLFFLVSCSDWNETPHTKLESPNAPFKAQELPSHEEEIADQVGVQPPASACDYITELSTISSEDVPHRFQFFKEVGLEEGNFVATVHPQKLAQARYGISGEKSLTGHSPYQALGIEDFYRVARLELCKAIQLYCFYDMRYEEEERETDKARRDAEGDRIEDSGTEAEKSSLSDLKSLKTGYWLARNGINKSLLRNARNEALFAGVNADLPGSIDGLSKNAESSTLTTMLIHAIAHEGLSSDRLKLSYLKANLYLIAGDLTKDLPLFPVAAVGDPENQVFWKELNRDARISWYLIQQKSEELTQKNCEFLLAQRLTAQLLTLKGIKGAPGLTAEGFFPTPPDNFEDRFSYPDEFLAYNRVATSDWLLRMIGNSTMSDSERVEQAIKKLKDLRKEKKKNKKELDDLDKSLLAKLLSNKKLSSKEYDRYLELVSETLPPERVNFTQGSSQAYIDALRYFLNFSSVQDPDFWQLGESLPVGTASIPGALYALNFGWSTMLLSNLQREELFVDPDTSRFSFQNQDQAGSVASLIHFNVEFQQAYQILRDNQSPRKDFVIQQMGRSTVQQYLHPNSGPLDRVQLMGNGGLREAVARTLREDRGSDELSAAVRRYARYKELRGFIDFGQ